MYIKQLTSLHTHLKGDQKAFTPSRVMPLGSSVLLLEKLTAKSRVIEFLSYNILVKNCYGGYQKPCLCTTGTKKLNITTTDKISIFAG